MIIRVGFWCSSLSRNVFMESDWLKFNFFSYFLRNRNLVGQIISTMLKKLSFKKSLEWDPVVVFSRLPPVRKWGQRPRNLQSISQHNCLSLVSRASRSHRGPRPHQWRVGFTGWWLDFPRLWPFQRKRDFRMPQFRYQRLPEGDWRCSSWIRRLFG